MPALAKAAPSENSHEQVAIDIIQGTPKATEELSVSVESDPELGGIVV